LRPRLSSLSYFPRDLIARKFYASNFEQIMAQTFPDLAKPLINTTTQAKVSGWGSDWTRPPAPKEAH
jgi:hypothetical protein